VVKVYPGEGWGGDVGLLVPSSGAIFVGLCFSGSMIIVGLGTDPCLLLSITAISGPVRDFGYVTAAVSGGSSGMVVKVGVGFVS
jgi:hypothetical protein